MTTPVDVVSIIELVANLGVAGLVTYMLKKVYTEREMEPHMGDEEWTPASDYGLA